MSKKTQPAKPASKAKTSTTTKVAAIKPVVIAKKVAPTEPKKKMEEVKTLKTPQAKLVVVKKAPVIKAVVKKPVTKSSSKSSKPPLKKTASSQAKSISQLVHTSDLMSKALHVSSTAPWDTETTEQPKPKDKVPDRSEYAKPPTVKTPSHQTKGLTMSEIRAGMAHPVNAQVTSPAVLHKEPAVKTNGALSIKEVMRHVAQTTRVGR